ncbi:C4-dicarboxylate TRAP transporter substrate-binding protein [Pseudaminobacter sp. 19-2017]|uniref:C4-dicarboxylate TRAP transporter substrate-binding protein n=1 Tax=Pseudaminobacter soli (ex Zhang et al. 2022) TaxID=2831468 RepID=A0A942E2Y0_9HYPH|nr:C4-dicarboxylate TRAP transporter substrate-binding protein [Pseudaminobacter soli]MBS3651982.1 C4-dicarboxylate TRAP transporter substrate-binding protein [Pseudaminobacter soli]
MASTNLLGRITTTVLLGLALGAGQAAAKDLRYATGFAPNSTGAKAQEASAAYGKEISKGDLNIRVYPQSLLSFTEMSGGVRDNIAEMGMVLFPYFPAEFPNSTMVSEMTMLFSRHDTGDRGGLAWTGALIEYITLNCPACTDEMAAQNQVFTSSSSTEYTMMCMKKIETAADMQGVRIRAPGAHWTRWANSVGATSVSVPQNEIFEGLSQGILDCSLSGTAELVDLSLVDAVKYIIHDVPGGGFGGTGLMNVNLDVWASLTPEQRTELLRIGAHGSAYGSWNYRTNNLAALEAAQKKGIEIVTPSEDFLKATREFTNADLKLIAKTYAEKYGLKDTDQAVQKMSELFEKWVGLVANVESAEAYQELLWNEAYSKINVETYGM